MRRGRCVPTRPEGVDGADDLGRKRRDTKGHEACREIGKRVIETDLEGHDDIREDACDQIISFILRFASEDVCRMISKEEDEGEGWIGHLYLSYTT
jgi:hypothetical protein